METFNWGILAPGKIARKFASDLSLIEGAKVHAVASRSLERAEAFAKEYGATHAFGSYEELATCPDLHAVYVATPHTGHCENSLMLLKNKVPVLCEKPFAMNEQEVQQMIRAAEESDTFLMEAFWTRFFPTIKKTQELIKAGRIGEIQSVRADFGFKAPYNIEGRVLNKKLGGGSLLDVGIYPTFLALLILGKPDEIKAFANIGQTGVDESCAMIFKYNSEKIAILDSSIVAHTPTEAFIYGSKGFIKIQSRFHESSQLVLNLYGEEIQRIDLPVEGKGYHFEAKEVMDCIQAGKKESDLMPHSFSLLLIQTLDRIRKEINLIYDNEA